MKYRRLGSTELVVSEVGFGAWGIGGPTEGLPSYGSIDDGESILALKVAFDNGITFYDTSDLYGRGHSERLLGVAFRGSRDKVVIATKVGLSDANEYNLSPLYMRAALEMSLERLGTDYIDLYQVHSPPLEFVTEEAVETLREFVKEGKVRAYGFSTKNPNDGIFAVRSFGFGALQVNFNMIDQRIVENGLISFAGKQDVGLIARTPFNFGFLAGVVKDISFDSHDHRSRWPEGQLKKWAAAPELFSFLNQGKNRTLAQLALQFCLSFPEISVVIPGVMHPREAEEDAAASDLPPLTSREIKLIQEIYASNFSVPVKL